MESGTWEGATEPVFSTSCLCQEQMRLCREGADGAFTSASVSCTAAGGQAPRHLH